MLTECVTGLEQDKIKLTKLLKVLNRKIETHTQFSPDKVGINENFFEFKDPDNSSEEDFFDAVQDPALVFGPSSNQTASQVPESKSIMSPSPFNEILVSKPPPWTDVKITTKEELFGYLKQFDPVKYVGNSSIFSAECLL